MAATLRFRVQEWLAERFRFVQFPRQQFIPRQPPPPFFRHAMPSYMRFGLIVFGVLTFGIAIAVIGAVGLLFWAIISA